MRDAGKLIIIAVVVALRVSQTDSAFRLTIIRYDDPLTKAACCTICPPPPALPIRPFACFLFGITIMQTTRITSAIKANIGFFRIEVIFQKYCYYQMKSHADTPCFGGEGQHDGMIMDKTINYVILFNRVFNIIIVAIVKQYGCSLELLYTTVTSSDIFFLVFRHLFLF